MDDILGSVPTIEERENRTEEITHILDEKGFHIKEWIINTNLNNTVENHTSLLIDIMIKIESSHSIENVLGYRWNVVIDTFEFKINITIDINAPVTRRNILKILNGFFDPLGFISPFLVIGKIVLRKVYALEPKLGWDDLLPEFII